MTSHIKNKKILSFKQIKLRIDKAFVESKDVRQDIYNTDKKLYFLLHRKYGELIKTLKENKEIDKLFEK